MKHVSYVSFCAILLCSLALRAQSALTLSADDVKFLRDCGVRQDDIKVIPRLPSEGQIQISAILSAKECSSPSLKDFIETRNYLRKFTPPPSECPLPPAHYWLYFLTKTEAKYLKRQRC